MRVIKQEFDPAISIITLQEHPQNPRRGDSRAVAASVEATGFYGAVLVQRSTKRIIAGHTRLSVARSAGAETVPGFWLDVTDDEAARILLADNRTSDLAFYDDAALADLLSQMVDDGQDLFGTGYDDAAFQMLLDQTKTQTDDFIGNVRMGPTTSDRSELREQRGVDIRSIILPYSVEMFDQVVEAMSALRSARGISNNSELIRQLLAEAQ